MNRLPNYKRKKVLHLLVEGSSMRSISRVESVSFNTVKKLMLNAGCIAAKYHDEHVRNIDPQRIECDEIWAFCYAKDKNLPTATAAPDEASSIWTWTAIDPDTKLFISWLVGNRDATSAIEFMNDLQSRLSNRIQLTTDGLLSYPEAFEDAFGGDVDFAQLIKFTSEENASQVKSIITGDPDPKFISTSIVERQNLTMRMSMR